jgi:chromate transporter
MAPADPGSLRHAARTWGRIGLLSFGGPAGQIALMHRILVDEKRWIDEDRFLHALKFCTLLPGPEAQQLATYVGWLLHGVPGGLVAGSLFVLPGVLVLLALSWIYYRFGAVPAVGGALLGLKAAVLALVIQAVVRLARRALPTRDLMIIAVLSFLALALFRAPFPLVVVGAALVGVLFVRPPAPSTPIQPPAAPSALSTIGLAVVGLMLWVAPIVVAAVALGSGHRLTRIGVFMSQAAVVTFGGAYAVLTYAAQRVVEGFGWLAPHEMIDGLGLAETTPGPLILVLQFVGFLAGARSGPPVEGTAGGVIGAAITVWTTFVPSILFVLLGAPYMERLRQWRGLDAALTAITAAVLGVITNLAVWFALHALFAAQTKVRFAGGTLDLPVLRSLDPPALVLTVAAAVAVFRFRRGILEVLGGAAIAGLLWQLVRIGTRP